MRRTMSNLMSAPSSINYQPVNTDDTDVNTLELKKKKKGILCASSRKRMYILLILSSLALLWVFIYYKLLDHQFELPEPLREFRKIFGDGKAKQRRGRWEETENIIAVKELSCLPQFKSGRNSEQIHIVLVACRDRVDEAIVNMKAITLITNYNIYFHIFTDEKNYKKGTFEKELKKWPSFATEHWMMFDVNLVHYPFRDRDEGEEWLNLFKPCASQRLFLPSILVDEDAVIYVDTDVLFLKPPEELWKLFKEFNRTQLAGLTNECETQEQCWYDSTPKTKIRHPFFKPYGINSGVMLMNLTRMREKKWEKGIKKIYKKHKEDLTWGDQDLLNIYFERHRQLLYIFSCSWNYRPDHCVHGKNTCSNAIEDGISLLHGNHLSFHKKQVQPEFYVIHQAYVHFDFKKHDFQKDIVNSTEIILKKKYFDTSCGQMVDAIMKSIKCTTH